MAKKQPNLNYADLAKDMRVAAKVLDSLPDDREFAQEEIDLLDDLRMAAFQLMNVAEATIETWQGGA